MANNILLNKLNRASQALANQLYTNIKRMDENSTDSGELIRLYVGLIYCMNAEFQMGLGFLKNLTHSDNKYMRLDSQKLYDMFNNILKEILRHKDSEEKVDIQHEFSEDMWFCVLYISVLASILWEETKTIYSLDNNFASYFGDSDELKIYIKDLFYLPFNTFYLDLSKVERLKNSAIQGVEVSVSQFSDSNNGAITGFALYCTCFLDNGLGTAQYFNIYFDECEEDNGIYYYKYQKMYMPQNTQKYILTGDSQDTYASDIDYLIMLVWNFLAYITSKKPDIKESKISVKAKDRAKRLNKPYQEETVYEVGYRYGKAISLYSERVEKEYTEHRQLEGERKSPRPHLVKAHWHGYWCGKGKKEWEYLWVAPYYQGYGEIDCVIHDCIEVDKSQYSKGEETLYFLLTMKGIPFERQYYIVETGRYFDTCVYIDGKEIFVEYDGAQHFRPVKNWDFEKTVASDTEKNEYCRENNIPLLRIRYDQDLYMSDILDTLKENPEQYLERLNPYLTDDEYYSIRKEV